MNLYNVGDCLEGDLFVISPLRIEDIQGRINIIRQEMGSNWTEEKILEQIFRSGNLHVVRLHEFYEEAKPAVSGTLYLDPAAKNSCSVPLSMSELAAENQVKKEEVIAKIRAQSNEVTPLEVASVKSKVESGLVLQEVKEAPIPLHVKEPGIVDKVRSLLKNIV